MASDAVLAAAVTAAYALGTFPTASLVARAYGRDPTREGSGNPGASNVYRLAGRRAAAAVFVGDALKGSGAAALGWAVDGRSLAAACGAVAVLGHCFPVTRGLRGGKGVATGAGVLAVMLPGLAAAAAVTWAALARLTRKASLASLVAVVLVVVGLFALRGLSRETAVLLGTALLVVARHAGNLARLFRGEERSLQ
ncbi:MAG TPA: glycerol-3-phosphate acyltransferase [Acidimicrobiales bacterium]|nr:glycerol-3-phosphate acyltransferase [Acidimicrobiales bacterium]